MSEPTSHSPQSADPTVVASAEATRLATVNISAPSGISNISSSISGTYGSSAMAQAAPARGRSPALAVALGVVTGLVLFALTALWLVKFKF